MSQAANLNTGSHSPWQTYSRLRAIMTSGKPMPATQNESMQLTNKIHMLEKFPDVLNVLESAQVRPDKYVYTVIFAKNYGWAIKKFVYDNLPENCKNIYNLNCFICAAIKVNEFDYAKNAFEYATQHNIVNSFTFRNYLCATRNFRDLSATFNEARMYREGQQLDQRTYINFIKKLSEFGYFSEAEFAFLEIEKPNVDAFKTIIRAAVENKNKLRTADYLNRMMEKLNITNENTYIYMIKAANKMKLYDQALAIADQAIESGFSSSQIHDLQIHALVRKGD
jgi:tetratricopeptide (TPR) repeat protein